MEVAAVVRELKFQRDSGGGAGYGLGDSRQRVTRGGAWACIFLRAEQRRKFL